MKYSIKTVDGTRYDIDKEPVLITRWNTEWLSFASGNVTRLISIYNIVSVKVTNE